MSREFNFDGINEEFFYELISSIDSHESWTYTEGRNRPVEVVSQEASEFQSETEFWIDHDETDGTLYFNAPSFGDHVSAAFGVLKQPLDGTQRQEPYPGSFGEKIMDAYQSVASGFDSEYIQVEPDPISILSVEVPVDYDHDKLNDGLERASQISEEIQEVNDDVSDILEQYRR